MHGWNLLVWGLGGPGAIYCLLLSKIVIHFNFCFLNND